MKASMESNQKESVCILEYASKRTLSTSDRARSSFWVSFWSAIGFAVAVVILIVIARFSPPTRWSTIDTGNYVGKVMLCVFAAAFSSIVSVICAVHPVMQRDRRPLLWLFPLMMGWILLFVLFDWAGPLR